MVVRIAASLMDSATGWGFFLLSNGALLYAAHLSVRRFYSEAPAAARTVALGTTIVVLVLVTAQALSAMLLFNRMGVALACLLLAACAHHCWRDHRNIRDDVEPLKAWFYSVIASRGAILLCAAVVVVLLAATRAVTRPPLSWDALTYHLFFAARYVQLGHLAEFSGPYSMDHYSYFPINGEILAAWLLLPFQSDLMVNLLNFPFLALGAVAIYGLCRELGLKWDDAALAACFVCFSPFLFAYLTTQYVDIQVFAALMCAASFVVRYLNHRSTVEAFFAFAALGIAIGTKYTALAIASLLLGTLIVLLLLHGKRRRAGWTSWMIVFSGLLLVALVGGRQYARNWWEKGNPLYPLELALAGRTVLHGSPYTSMIAAEAGKGSRRDDLNQMVQVFNYFPTWRLSTSAGPKFLPLFVLACVALVGVRTRSPAQRLLALYGVVGFIAFYLPDEGFPAVARRIWPGASTRFLAPSLALITIAAMPAVASLSRRYSAVTGLLAGFVLWDMIVSSPSVPENFPLAAGLGTAAAILVSPVVVRPWCLKLLKKRYVALFLGGSVLSLSGLQWVRSESRWAHYRNSIDVHWIPREFVSGWRYCDQGGEPLRIALATGWEHRGQNWFFYPLLGSRLQNTVTYVPADDERLHGLRSETGGGRDKPAFSTWLRNLRREKIDTIFVQKPWPVEEQWINENPDTFRLLLAGDAFKIYRLL